MSSTWFFDLDGTLTDPKTGITRCIQHAMRKMGSTPPEMDELTWSIGPPLHGTFSELLGEALAAEAVAHYRERFASVGWQENVPYAGIHDALKQLQDSGATLYVATSKPRVFAERIIGHFGFAEYFERVFGCELDGTYGEKTDLLRYALDEVKPTGDVTMIGDRKFDIAAARANGVRALGVTYGYGSVDELTTAGADALVATPPEIAAA